MVAPENEVPSWLPLGPAIMCKVKMLTGSEIGTNKMYPKVDLEAAEPHACRSYKQAVDSGDIRVQIYGS